MKTLRPGFLALTALATCSLFGQNRRSPQSSDRLGVYAELNKVPERERDRKNPLAPAPDSIAAGRKLFDQHCADCHGEKGKGTRQGPNLRVPSVQQATEGALFSILTNGVVRRGMPVWSKLPEAQRWQIVLFLKSLCRG